MKQLLWLSCAVLAACGGSVLEDTSSGAGGGSTTSGTGDAGTTSGPTTSTVTGSGTAGEGSNGVGESSVGVGGSGDGGASPGVGGGGDGGFGAGPGSGGSDPVGVGGSGQTSTGSGDPPIACGMEECDPASEVCCATFNGAACIPADQDCQGATITCTSVAQCDDGEICCGTFGGGNGQTSCTSEPCGGGGPGSGVQLCESDAECPPDVPCEPAPGGIGFNFCNPGFG